MSRFKTTLRFAPSYILFFAAIIATVTIGSIYLYFFHDLKIGNTNDFAAFGDFFGGTLNPILALITIWFLVHTANLQRAELTAVIKEAEENNKTQRVIAKQNLDAMSLPDIRLALDKNLEEIMELINRKDFESKDQQFFSIYEAFAYEKAKVVALETSNYFKNGLTGDAPESAKKACANLDGAYQRLRLLYLSLREYQLREGALSYQKHIVDIAIAANRAVVECDFNVLDTDQLLKKFRRLQIEIERKMNLLDFDGFEEQ